MNLPALYISAYPLTVRFDTSEITHSLPNNSEKEVKSLRLLPQVRTVGVTCWKALYDLFTDTVLARPPDSARDARRIKGQRDASVCFQSELHY